MSDIVVMSQPSGFKQAFGRIRGSAVGVAADGLCLAATPAFALMALLTAIHGGDIPDMLCSATQGMSPLSGMVPMYLLMSVFHLSPWLKLFSRRRNDADPA